MKKLTTIGERFSWALMRIGSNPTRTAEAVGCSAALLTNLKNNKVKTTINFELGIKLANYLQVTPEWLATGKTYCGINIIKGAEQRQVKENPNHPILAVSVPVISWQEASTLAIRTITDIPEKKDRRYITNAINKSLNSYAIVMQGDSMIDITNEKKSFHDGDFLYFDPGIRAYIGTYILARDVSCNNAVFRQLVYDCGKVFLKPHNQSYPVLKYNSGNIIIQGVLVESRQSYNHVYNPKEMVKRIIYLDEIT